MSPVLRLLPFVLGIAIVILLGILIFVPASKKAAAPAQSPALTPYTTKLHKTLEVNLKQGDRVQSPLHLRGVATGWYFEGSFPVKVLDTAGKVLGQGIATAQTDWMTSAPVPFAASIEFKTPSSSSGTVLLQNDNPSDMRQYDDEVRIPVTF